MWERRREGGKKEGEGVERREKRDKRKQSEKNEHTCECHIKSIGRLGTNQKCEFRS
jgi:hypothetical protein